MTFASALLQWNESRQPAFPWIHETNPYRILLSEFLLQQTRSDQAVGYYERMLNAFPTIEALAQTSEDNLLRHWQGLGYYSRARNLHKTALLIVQEHGGKVPDSYDELIRLPGIGPYTAAAIASFAFSESRAVVDGNVYRVLARFHGIDLPVNSSTARKHFTAVATELLGDHDPAKFNQAIMNLGAHQCTPKNPDCTTCPLHLDCLAFASETQHLFPVKHKKKPNKDRYFHFLDIGIRGQTLIEKRSERDIWQGLYQFPLIERPSNRALSKKKLTLYLDETFGLSEFRLNGITEARKQTLSHQHIHARFYKIKVNQKPGVDNSNFTLVFRENLENFALPKTITWYLNLK